jgi:hypothetical protein
MISAVEAWVEAVLGAVREAGTVRKAAGAVREAEAWVVREAVEAACARG